MAEQFDVQRELDALRAARESEVDESFQKEVDAEPMDVGAAVGATWGWTKRLPRNVGMGAFRAILNTVETVDNAFEAGGQMVANMDANATNTSSANEGKPPVEPIDTVPPLQTLFPGVFEAAHNFADSVEANNTMSDDITQGIAQFAIPFTGWLKAVGGIHKGATMLNLGRLALAEGVTAASAFEAHEGRMADLIEMGRQMDNKFGEVLQRVSPDGSLANTYINWLTDRENEGEWEGRFKNAVDSVVTTAGIAPFLKGAAMSIRGAKQIIQDVGTKVTPMELQRGSIGVRPEVKFDLTESVATVSGKGTTIRAKRGDTTVGHMELAQRGTALQVLDVRLDESIRGRGLSTNMYVDAIENARTRGYEKFVSDTEVSLQAVNTWEALKRRGYEVVRNPDVETAVVDRGGEKRRVLQSTNNRPVFSVVLEAPKE